MGKRENVNDKISKKMLFAWPSRSISFGVASILYTYLTLYATDYMHLSPVSVGMVLLISKVFDGVTDFFAGVIIDRTHTRLGKARPYELALIGYWLFTVLAFSAPSMSENAGLIYLFVMYTIANSVFVTLLNCSEAVYLANALKNKQQSVPIVAFAGIVGMIFTVIASMIIPPMITSMGDAPGGWTKISLILAVPFTIFGLLRFFVIKEVTDSNVAAGQKLNLKEMVYLLFHNKYILLVAVLILLSNTGIGMNANAYFYKYILGDLNIASIMSLTMLAAIVLFIVFPPLSKKIGLRRCIQISVIIGVIGYLIRLVDIENQTLIFVANLLSAVAFVGLFAFVAPLVIDCMDYGEWKNNKRSEGVLNAAQSIMAKIGAAVGTGLLGLLMGISGYDGALDVQTTSANNMIIALYSVIPAAIGVVMLVLLQFYDLDKKLPAIRSELAARAAKEETIDADQEESQE